MKMQSSLSNGRAVIPASLRAKLDMQDGDELIWTLRDGELTVTTRRAQLRRAQDLVKKYVPAGVSLTEELIAERRAEQAKEDSR